MTDTNEKTYSVPAILVEAGICKSRSEGRRLITQGAVYFNGVRIPCFEFVAKDANIIDKDIRIKVGYKVEIVRIV